MEEQTDTRRTETEKTDHKREHAFHTQHAMPTRGEASTSATFNDVLLLDRSMYYWASMIRTLIEQQMYIDIAQHHASLLLMLLLSCTLKTLILDVSSKVFIQP